VWRLGEAPGGLDSVDVRHPDIHQRDVGQRRGDQPEG
jgi:hypothetical protein